MSAVSKGRMTGRSRGARAAAARRPTSPGRRAQVRSDRLLSRRLGRGSASIPF